MDKKLEKWTQEREEAIRSAREIHERAESEERSFTDEESGKYAEHMARARDLKDKIDRQVEIDRQEASLRESRGLQSDDDDVESREAATEKDEDRRARAFAAYLERGRSGLLENPETRALQADLDVSGGYTVAPQQFVRELIQAVDNLLFVRQIARVFPVTSSDSLGAPSLDTDPADGAWTSEIGAASEDSSMAFGARELAPHQLTKLLKVSDKLLMTSALPIESIVRERLAYILATPQENTFLNGTGAGQPLGVFTASSNGISTGQDVSTGNTTTSIQFDGLKTARGTLKSQYRSKANWIFHRDAETQISKLKDGNGQYIWQSSVTAGDPDRLLGFPVRVSEYAPSTFTTGLYVGILGDFSKYWIAELEGFNVQRLDELYSANNQVGFKVRAWIDGMPVLEEAFVRVTLA